MNPGRRVLTLLVLLPMLALAQAPTVYKWVDKKGQVHYSQTPPPKGQFETVTTKPQRSISAAPAPGAEPAPGQPSKLQEYLDDTAKSNAERDAQKVKVAQETERRRQRCDEARTRQATLDRYGRVGTVQADGSFNAWSDEKRDAQQDAVQKAMAENC